MKHTVARTLLSVLGVIAGIGLLAGLSSMTADASIFNIGYGSPSSLPVTIEVEPGEDVAGFQLFLDTPLQLSDVSSLLPGWTAMKNTANAGVLLFYDGDPLLPGTYDVFELQFEPGADGTVDCAEDPRVSTQRQGLLPSGCVAGGIDTAPPTVSDDSDQLQVSCSPEPVTVTIAATDSLSGIAEVRYCEGVGCNPATVLAAPYALTYEAETDTTVRYEAEDNAGNVSTIGEFVVRVDTTPPESLKTQTGVRGSADWYVSDVTVTLAATDETCGVDRIEYSFDGTEFFEYTAPLVMTTQGANDFFWRAYDTGGNAEALQADVIFIDKPVAPDGTVEPVADAQLDGMLGGDDWYVSDVAVILGSQDSISGPDTIEYCIDGGPFQAYAPPLVITQPGVTTVDYFATDVAGNQSEAGQVTVSIDEEPPVSAATILGAAGPTGWYPSASVEITATDNYSGVDFIEYSLDGVTYSAYASPVAVTASGANAVYYRATDVAGNVEAPQTIEVLVDPDPPVTTAEGTGTLGDNGWYVSDVSVTLDATDELSGVASTEYSLDGSAYTAYVGPFLLSEEGADVRAFYRSADNAGNHEAAKSSSFKIDQTAPATTAVLDGVTGLEDWYVTDVVVTLEATDATSGVAQIEYSLDGQAYEAYAGPVTVSQDGEQTLSFRATDQAGNVEETQTVEFRIDQTAPVTTKTLNDPDDDGYVDSFTLEAADETSGVSEIYYSLNGETPQLYVAGEEIALPGGTVDVAYFAVDVAGNAEAENTQQDQGDLCPGIPGFRTASEYVLDITSWTASGTPGDISATPRVFAGNAEIQPDADGLYRVPIVDGDGLPIVDKTDRSQLPDGVWVISRLGGGRWGDDDSSGSSAAAPQQEAQIVAGLWGYFSSGTLAVEATETVDGGSIIRNYWRDRYERQGDGTATLGTPGQDEFTSTITDSSTTIDNQATVRPRADLKMWTMPISGGDFQGCPRADITNVKLHIVDQQRTGVCGTLPNGRSRPACTLPLEGAGVKIFNRRDANFLAAYGSQNPSKNLSDDIYENDIGKIGQCVTNVNGTCFAPEEEQDKLMVVVKWTDPDTGSIVYTRKNKNFASRARHTYRGDEDSDSSGAAADAPLSAQDRVKSKNLRILKLMRRNGEISYKGAQRTLVLGSELVIDAPDYVVWQNSEELYPFVFESAETWEVNVCMQVPDGYEIAGVQDIDGNVIATTECVQTLVANEAKVLLFRLVDMESPEPETTFTMTVTEKETGEVTEVAQDISGVREDTEEEIEAEADERAARIVAETEQAEARTQREQAVQDRQVQRRLAQLEAIEQEVEQAEQAAVQPEAESSVIRQLTQPRRTPRPAAEQAALQAASTAIILLGVGIVVVIMLIVIAIWLATRKKR